ncbi:biotin/lipoyl-binding protein, partial [Pseudomonas syringae]
MCGWRLAVAGLASRGWAGAEKKQQKDHAESRAPEGGEGVTFSAEWSTVVDELPGRIEPVRVAQVRARVAGIVLSRNCEEGADVKAGAVLLPIDPAPLKAALSKAQGDLARAEATLFETQATVKRYGALVAMESVSRQTFATADPDLQTSTAANQPGT